MSFSFPELPAQVATPVAPQPGQAPAPTAAKARRSGAYRAVFKRALDVTAVILAAPVVVPVVALLAVGVARDGGSPFYSQERIGKDGRLFRMWKLRSMVRDADRQMRDLLARDPEARAEWDATQKLRNDPRITPFGHLLRRSSLDELPQLWNVLRGEMSLVGPRPMMTDQRDLYPGTAYYALRPGVTGYWQTAGRNSTTFSARAVYDTAYEASVTLSGDLHILWRTVAVVLKRTGC